LRWNSVVNISSRSNVVKSSKAWNLELFLTLVIFVKLRFISNVYFHIFTNICRENGRKCITNTCVVAMQPDAYALCYGNAHWRVTGPLWLKIGKLAASELCEYFVFNGIRAFTCELSATLSHSNSFLRIFRGSLQSFRR